MEPFSSHVISEHMPLRASPRDLHWSSELPACHGPPTSGARTEIHLTAFCFAVCDHRMRPITVASDSHSKARRDDACVGILSEELLSFGDQPGERQAGCVLSSVSQYALDSSPSGSEAVRRRGTPTKEPARHDLTNGSQPIGEKRRLQRGRKNRDGWLVLVVSGRLRSMLSLTPPTDHLNLHAQHGGIIMRAWCIPCRGRHACHLEHIANLVSVVLGALLPAQD
jgi:hypothetical protein